MNKRIKWTEDKIEFLRQNYGPKSALEIANILCITKSSVTNKINALGLKTNDEHRLTNGEQKLYNSGHIILGKYTVSSDKISLACKFCGKEFTAQAARIISNKTKSCGCLFNINRAKSGYSKKRTGGQYISGTCLSSFIDGAKERNIEWNLSIEYLDKLLLEQNFLCALSGKPLIYGYMKPVEYTISLDRIDSTKGYIEGNVQWVHKHLNIMKLNHSQDYFIEICRDVSNFQDKNNEHNT